MENETTNLFRRKDTFFGACEAVGQDFGFNPLWVRLAFIAPLFFFPVQTFMAYFGLCAIVLASRLTFPRKVAAHSAAAVQHAAPAAAQPAETAEQVALAA